MENDIFDVLSGGLIATNAASFLRQERWRHSVNSIKSTWTLAAFNRHNHRSPQRSSRDSRLRKS
jgi:hypothetical protein